MADESTVFAITASVGAGLSAVPVVSPLNYTLDTTAPTYTPVVRLQTVTGYDATSNTTTGFTSNKTLLSSTNMGSDRTVYEQVQIIQSGTDTVVRDWTSLSDFNSSSLGDGHYTLRTRLIDTAGNVGRSGADVTLNLDTQSATVDSLTSSGSAAAQTAWQQDAFVNSAEVGSPMQFSLVFSEKVKGVTRDNLLLSVSGDSSTRPTLDSVTALNPDARGYATTWLITVKDLHKLIDAETLQLSVKDGLQIVDQAGNRQDALTYAAGPLVADLSAAFTWTGASTQEATPISLLQSSATTPSFTVNRRSQSLGVQLSGSVQGVEAGQDVVLSLIGLDEHDQEIPLGSPLSVRVQDNNTWSAVLDNSNWLNLLADKTNYLVRASIHDQAGNTATGAVLTLKSRLNANIDVNFVEANNLTMRGLSSTVLDFNANTSGGGMVDPYVNTKDKQFGAVEATSPDDTGFTVHGASNIGSGRLVTVALTKVGTAMSPLISTGTVDESGQWSVHFTSNIVNALNDGTWQFTASGSDADGNVVNSDDPLTQTDPHSRPTFIVDTQASVTLNALGVNNHVNKTRDGNTLTITGTFVDIDPNNTLTLVLRDKNVSILSAQVVKTWSDIAASDLILTPLDARTTQWSYQINLAELDGLSLVLGTAPGETELAKLSLTASSSDKAGNTAAQTVLFDLDRTAPDTPVPGTAVRRVAGSSLESSFTNSLKSSATLQDPTVGVFIAPNAQAPTATDVASVWVDAVSYAAGSDQWRVQDRLWSMDADNNNTAPLTLGTGSNAFNVVLSYTVGSDNVGRLIVKANGGGLLSPTQVQTVLRSLAWVNTSSDADLDQMGRTFHLSYQDAQGNVGLVAPVNFSVDTLAPTVLGSLDTETPSVAGSGAITITTSASSPASQRANTLNNLTTGVTLKATIASGQATGGRADFYVGTTWVGADTDITNDDVLVVASVGSDAASLRSLIPAAGGVVSVKLYDAAGNMITTSGPTLLYDIVAPKIARITSDTANGAYKEGASIGITLTTDEDVTAGSSLVVTLGSVVSGSNVALSSTAARTVVLTRDSTDARKFTGNYTVLAGDNSADLAVIGASSNTAAGAVLPRDAAGNPMSFLTSGRLPENTLAGSKDLVIDTTPPELSRLSLTAKRGGSDLASGSSLKAGDVVTVTASYSEDVQGTLTEPTLTIGSETSVALTAGTTSGSSRTWTYTVSNTGTTDTGAISVVGDFKTGFTDAAGNAVTGTATNPNTYTADTTPPVLNSVTLSAKRGSSDLATGSSLKAGDVVTVTAAYSEEVQGTLTAPTLTLGSETGVALTAGVTTGNTRTWTYTISADGATDTGAISVVGSLTSGLTDAAGNAATGTPSTTHTYSADTTAPVLNRVSMTAKRGEADLATGSSLKAGDVVTVTAEYSEDVQGTLTAPTLNIGTDETDVALTVGITTGSRRTWTYTISADGTTDTGVLSLVGDFKTGFTDAAGNAATGTATNANTYTADTTVPVLNSVSMTAKRGSSDLASGRSLKAGDVITVTASYSEAVQGTLTDPTLTIGSETGVALTAVTTSGSTRTWTYTVSNTDTTDTGAISVVGDFKTGLADAASNAVIGTATNANTYTADTTVPTLNSVSMTAKRGSNDLASGSSLKAGDVVTVTAAYSEAVEGTLTAPTLTIGSETGVALTAVTTSGSTRTWTYTVSNTGTTDTGSISLVGDFKTGFTDAAGNAVTGTAANTNTYTADTTVPVLNSVSMTAKRGSSDLTSGSSLKVGDVVTVTAAYSEDVQGTLTEPTLTIGSETGVALTADTTTGSTRTWTYTVSNTDTTDTGSISVVGDFKTGFADAAGNAVTGTAANTNTYTADTTVPTLNSVTFSAKRGSSDLASGSSLKAGDVVTVTAAYSEAVQGTLTAPTLTIGSETGVTLTAVTTTGSTRSWTYTISADGTTDTGAISVVGSLSSGLSDAAGNAVTGSPSPTGTYTADTTVTAPTLLLDVASDNGTSTSDRLLSGSSFVLKGLAEQGASVTVKRGSVVMGTVTASTSDGSWSLTVTSRVTVAGLRSGVSTANGTYTLLTATEVAALAAFSGNFSPIGITILDTTKPVYKWVNGTETWYMWARQGSGYHISQATGTAEWYWESSTTSSFAAAPESVDSSRWVLSNVAASVVVMGDPANAVAQSGVVITNLSGQGAHLYTATQVDVAGNDSSTVSGGATSLDMTVDNLAPLAPQLGIQSASWVTASTAPAGLRVFPTLVAPAATDIQILTITLGGAGLDVANDKLTVGSVDHALNSSIAPVSNATLAGVTGVDWSYDSSTRVVTFKTHAGTAFVAADVLTLLNSLQLKTTSSTEGARTFTLGYTDVAGNASATTASTITLDTTPPSTVDLAAVSGVQRTSSVYANATSAGTGVALAAGVQAPAAGDTKTITVVLGGTALDTANDKLVLDSAADLNLSGSGSSITVGAASGVSVGSVSGLTYTYTYGTKTLEISRVNGSVLAAADVQLIVSALKYKNTTAASIAEGERTATFSYTDVAGNVGTSATTTLTVDRVIPTVTSIALINADGRQNNLLNTGDAVYAGVNFSEAVTLSGAPTLNLNIGSVAGSASGSVVQADYVSGSGTSTLVFKYVILENQRDVDGISIPVTSPATSPLNLNGGTIQDLAGNAANLANAAVADNTSYMVDAVAPTVSTLVITGADSSGTLKTGALSIGDKIKVVITTSEAVHVTGVPTVAIMVGSTARSARYDSGSGTNTLVFYYSIAAGDTAASNAVTTAANPLAVGSGASMADLAGNAALTAYASTASIGAATTVDTAGAPLAVVQTLRLSADTAPAGTAAGDALLSDFITSTAAQTISGTLSQALGTSEVVQISFDNGATWANASTQPSAGGTTFSHATTLSGSNTLLVNVKNTSTSRVNGAYTQAYALDTTLVNTFSMGSNVTSKPVVSGTADAFASITLDLDTNNSASTYEVTYKTTADATGYWAVNTASDTPTSGTFSGLPVSTSSSASTAGARVTATDKAGNTSQVTSSATVVLSTYSISNANVIEGTSGTKTTAFLVSRSGDLTTAGSVNYAVNASKSSASNTGLLNGDFSAGSLYGWTAAAGGAVAPTFSSGAAVFANATANQGGTLAQTLTTVVGQSYTVNWDQSSTATVGVSVTGTAERTFSVMGTNSYTFTATSTSTVLTFRDATSTTGTSVSLDNINVRGTQSVNSDYSGATAGTVNFLAGESSKLVTFTVNGDYFKEVNDTLQVDLSAPVNGSLIKSYGTARILEMDPTRMQVSYSLVDINPNLATAAIRVRRSSDNTQQDIGFDAYGKLDTAALLSFVGTGTGYVTRWYDQSGNGRDMVQNGTANQGVIVNAGSLVTRSDGSAGISLNSGLNGAYDSSDTNADYMTVAGVAGTAWQSVMVVMKAQSTRSNDYGSAFNLMASQDPRLSVHYGWGNTLYFDINTSSTASRVTGGTVTPSVANDLVFEGHTGNTTSGTAALNYTDANQAIFMDGSLASSNNTLTASIQTGATWTLGRHSSNYCAQSMIASEFMVYLATDNSTPSIQTLRGTSDDDVITYAGETAVTAIDGGSGYDALYLQGATNLDPSTLSGGMRSIEQIWAVNGATNTITLTDAVLLTNNSPLLINLDAGDKVVLNTTTYNFSASDTQNLVLGTTGNDVLKATGGNDRLIGRGGADTFTWLFNQTGTDRVDDFNTTNGSKLDITALLQGYTAGATLSNWVQVSNNGVDTTFQIDLDGAGSGTTTQTIVLKGVFTADTTAQQWVEHNLLKVL